jgi:multiple sugar transport system substrate-binding protein
MNPMAPLTRISEVAPSPSQTISRRNLLQQAGRGTAGLATGLALPGLLAACGGSGGGTATKLNVAYWSNVVPKQPLLDVLNGFGKQQNVSVSYFELPQDFGDTVQKMTTYLSSGYTGLDVLWLDDFMTATYSNAGWLMPLEKVIADANFSSIAPAQLNLSTYNGHRYRLPANFGSVIFFYRQDLFEKNNLSVPTTWDELIQVGQKLTKDGVYGLGIAGKNGNTELFNEMCYWMGQAGADPLHLDSAGSRQALQFVHDLIHRYKIAPPDTVTADYTTIQTAFENGKLAMWICWDGLYSGTAVFPNVTKNYKLGIAHPPKGPANNGTIIANWGWAINKYSKNQDLSARFIEYAGSLQSEITLAKTGNTPSRTDALTNTDVQKALIQAKSLADYVQNVELHYRPITARAQRVSDAFEQAVNKYLNNQTDLETAIRDGQQAVDQAQQG